MEEQHRLPSPRDIEGQEGEGKDIGMKRLSEKLESVIIILEAIQC